MRLFRHYTDLPSDARGAVMALGNFDGVHRGHQAVIAQTRRIAAARGRQTGVMTFEPHPRSVFRPDDPPFRLTPPRTKARELRELGVDILVSLHFDAAFSRIEAEAFVTDILHNGLGVDHVVVGYDFVYGHDRLGDAALLQRMGAELGFGVTVVTPVTSGAGTIYSSTRIRDLLVAGDPRGAAGQLGRPWEIHGRVEHGDARGRTIGFPTANINLGDYLRPATGVYAVRAGIEAADGGVEWHDGVANLGRRPTVNGTDIRLEVFLLDFSGDLYGRNMRVNLIERVRPEQKFSGLDELKARIAEDAVAARAMLAP